MKIEKPPPTGDNNWNRRASNLPAGLLIKVVAVGAVIAIGFIGWNVWLAFESLNGAARETQELPATAGIDTHCDAGEIPAKAGEPMSEGKCITDEFRFVITDSAAEGR